MTTVFMLSLACVCASLWRSVRGQDEVPDGEVMIFQNMTTEDMYALDLVQYSTLIRQVSAAQIVANASTSKMWQSMWNYQDYFVYSVSDDDCWAGKNISAYYHTKLLYDPYSTTDSMAKNFPYNLTKQQKISMSLKFTDDKIFVTSAYFQVFNALTNPSGFINLMETKSIKYNETNMSLVTDEVVVTLNKWDKPAKPGLTWQLPNITCITGYYIHVYKETIYVCASMKKDSETDLYVYRPVSKREMKIATLPVAYNFTVVEGTVAGSSIKMLVEPTPDKAFEMVLYIVGKPDLWILDINREDIFNVQTFRLDINITQIDYSMRTIMFFFNNAETKRSSFFIERNPGSRFRPNLLQVFADARFLKTLYSNENIEIIVEMYKQFQDRGQHEPGFVPPITHLLYKFDLYKRKMGIQISTQIFTTHLTPRFIGTTYRVDSFSTLDMIVLNNMVRIQSYPSFEFVARMSIILNMDAYSGFGSTSGMNMTYPLYTMMAEYDPYTEHYFMTPFGVQFTVGNVKGKTCDFLRQRVVRPYIMVKYNKAIEGTEYNITREKFNGQRLVIGLNDTQLNKMVYRFNFTFITNSSIIMGPETIWRGSNITSFQVNPNFEQRNIDLDLLVRGNFIVRVNSDASIRQSHSFHYYSATIDEVNKLTDQALYKIENYRIAGENDLHMQDIEQILAFARTDDKEIIEKLIMLKSKNDMQLVVYSVKGNIMKPLKPLGFASKIKKIFPMAENTYILFDGDGMLSLFYANNLTIVQLSFPGVSCLDIDMIAHMRIKPAFMCYNLNHEFTVYYIDQLIAKSLSNSLMNVELRKPKQAAKAPSLSKTSKIYMTEFYPGKIFIYHPEAKKGVPNLSMYYLDVEEFPFLTLVREFTLYSQHAEAVGLNAKIQSLEFVEDRLVVHYRVSDAANFIGVYFFEDGYNQIETKYYQIPSSYAIADTSEFKVFHKHFQSSMYSNPSKPYLLLQFSQNGDRNNLVIDAFAPLLETIPTVLLPKNSADCQGCELLTFTYYISSLDRIRYYSTGLLHFSRNPHNVFRDEKKFFYLFQLVDADRPKIYFSLDKETLASYKNLFQDFKKIKIQHQNFTFESHYAVSQQRSNVIKCNLTILQKYKQVDNTSLSNRVVQISNINLKEKSVMLDSKGRNPQIIMYNPNYTEIPEAKTFTVFDWQIQAESQFDNVVGTFKLIKPLKLVKTCLGSNVSDIVNVDTFCRAYKLVNNTLSCTKIGWIYFHETDIELFYKSSLRDIQPGDSVRFPFNVDECTENVVVNHTLISVCTYNNQRNLITTNLLDLSQNYSDITSINIYAKASSPRIVKTYENAFVSFSKTIIDERNIKGVANTFYFMHKMEFLKINQVGCLSPIQTSLQYVYGVDSKLTDTSMGVGKIANFTYTDVDLSNKTINKTFSPYRVSGVNINAGNLVYVQIFEESHHIGPFEITSNLSKEHFQLFRRTSSNNIKIGMLKVEASTEVRRVIFNKASIIDLVFDKRDAISDQPLDTNNVTNSTETLFQRFSLVNFPSYHAYVYRYQRTTDLSHISFFKLENPFAEIENKHWDNKPVCFKWACLIISTFGVESFVRVYDMRYEELAARHIPPNFKIIFPSTTYNDVTDKMGSNEKDSINVDQIPAEYTIFPIQVINVTNLRLIRFDETKENNETLTILMFVKPNSMRIYDLNRKARLIANNLYFTSAHIELKAISNYNTEHKYQFIVQKYVESDFYKYFIQLILILIATTSLAVVYFKYLKSEQARIEMEDRKECDQETEMRVMLINELKNITLNSNLVDQDNKEEIAKERMSLAVNKIKPKLSVMFQKPLNFEGHTESEPERKKSKNDFVEDKDTN